MGIEELLLERFEKKFSEQQQEIVDRIRQEVIEERNTTHVKSLLTKTDLDLQKIATIVNVPYSFVEDVKASIH